MQLPYRPKIYCLLRDALIRFDQHASIYALRGQVDLLSKLSYPAVPAFR